MQLPVNSPDPTSYKFGATVFENNKIMIFGGKTVSKEYSKECYILHENTLEKADYDLPQIDHFFNNTTV